MVQKQKGHVLLSRKTVRQTMIILAIFLFGCITLGCAADDEAEMSRMDVSNAGRAADNMAIEYSTGHHESGANEEAVSEDIQPVTENSAEHAVTENEQEHHEETDRKIIQERWLKQQVQDVGTVLARVEHILRQTPGAYIESLQEWQNEEQGHGTEHHAQVIMRIPHEEWEALEKEIEEQGIVQHRQVSGTDVTEEYIDNEARLRNLQAHEERILDLYEEANTVEDVLEIEEELSRIRGNIEDIEGRQQYLDNVTSTVKVTLELFEVEEHEYAGAQSGDSLWDEARLGFRHSVENLLLFLQRLLVLVVAWAPYLFVLAVIGGSIFFGRWMYVRNKKKNG